jgi:two-component system response regulator AtoC
LDPGDGQKLGTQTLTKVAPIVLPAFWRDSIFGSMDHLRFFNKFLEGPVTYEGRNGDGLLFAYRKIEKIVARKGRFSIVHGSQGVKIQDLPPVEVIFGQTPGMNIVRERLERVAPTTVPVLLQGESGTGKEILAKTLHARSNRAKSAWVKVICPAIPNSLIESEMFGYEKGAFTGAYSNKRGLLEFADGGTLFLDEVASLDLSVQAKLLQVLQDGSFTRVGGHETRKIDTRIISSANGNLRAQTEEGSFRLDFFARINTVTIELLPLRKRTADLPVLIDYFLDIYSKEYRSSRKPLANNTLRLMQQFRWPGNIRQLENMIRSYVLIGSEEAVADQLVPEPVSRMLPEIDLANPISLKDLTKAATRNLELEVITEALRANGWNRQKTAKWLNISYRSLLYKLDGDASRLLRRPCRNRSPSEFTSTE